MFCAHKWRETVLRDLKTSWEAAAQKQKCKEGASWPGEKRCISSLCETFTSRVLLRNPHLAISVSTKSWVTTEKTSRIAPKVILGKYCQQQPPHSPALPSGDVWPSFLLSLVASVPSQQAHVLWVQSPRPLTGSSLVLPGQRKGVGLGHRGAN